MPFIYAAPFFLLSLLTALIFSAIPSLRRYSVQAAVAPLAFGFCSIVGMFTIILFNDFVRESFQMSWDALNQPLGLTTGMIIYVLPGLLGAWLAVKIVGLIRRTI